MSLIASEPVSDFSPAPEGMHPAVCCDVVDLGDELNSFNGKMQHKCRIVWQIEERHAKYDRPQEVSSIFTVSLHEKSMLRKVLQVWRGKPFSPDELAGFDLEKLIGVPCQVQVMHKVSGNGKTYANVVAVVPMGKGQTRLTVSPGYQRAQDRPGYTPPASANGAAQEPDAEMGEEGPCPF